MSTDAARFSPGVGEKHTRGFMTGYRWVRVGVWNGMDGIRLSPGSRYGLTMT